MTTQEMTDAVREQIRCPYLLCGFCRQKEQGKVPTVLSCLTCQLQGAKKSLIETELPTVAGHLEAMYHIIDRLEEGE